MPGAKAWLEGIFIPTSHTITHWREYYDRLVAGVSDVFGWVGDGLRGCGVVELVGGREMKPKLNRLDHTGLMDRCQTPAYALAPILSWLNFGWTIWEPAAGEGNITRVLQRYDYSVVATDILTGQNFFTYNFVRWDAIVTNPPFSLKYKWLARCYQLGKPFALLMPVEVLGAKAAQILFEDFGVEIIFTRPRISFKMPNAGWNGKGAQFPTAWFTWGLGIGQPMTFAKLNPQPDEQLVLL